MTLDLGKLARRVPTTEFDLLVTGPTVAGMASTDESLAPFMGLPKHGGSARLSGPSGGVDPRCPVLRKSGARARARRTCLRVVGYGRRGALLFDLDLPWVG